MASAMTSSSCESHEGLAGHALLQAQARRTVTPQANNESFLAEKEFNEKESNTHASSFGKLWRLNPSGAAAPLTNEGYLAVADRCCRAEMKEFITRQVEELNLQVCLDSGLAGLVLYHSCENGPQTFDALTADLLRDSTKACTFLADKSQSCKPYPPSCPEFSHVPPSPDCGCSRSAAAKLDLATATVETNNLGGAGPITTDPEEIRFLNAGTSSTGQAFDLVVESLASGRDTYGPGHDGNKFNGRSGEKQDGSFGVINLEGGLSVDFKFSFVMAGTETPLTLSEVHITLFDLDGHPGQDLEFVSSRGYSGYVTDKHPSIVASLEPDGRTKFTAEGVVPAIPNPIDPNALTEQQRKNAVMYFYKNVDSFEINYGVLKTGQRNLWYAFESSLDDRCGP